MSTYINTYIDKHYRYTLDIYIRYRFKGFKGYSAQNNFKKKLPKSDLFTQSLKCHDIIDVRV